MKVSELFEAMTDEEVKDFIKNWRALPTHDGKPRRFGKHHVFNGKVDMPTSHLAIAHTMLVDGKLAFPVVSSWQILVSVAATQMLKSFENFPSRISCSYYDKKQGYHNVALKFWGINTILTSLEGVPEKAFGNMRFENLTKLSYKSVHKHIHYVDGLISISGAYAGPLLGFMKIEALKFLVTSNMKGVEDHPKTDHAVSIVANAIQHKLSLFDTQEELIKNNFKEFASL